MKSSIKKWGNSAAIRIPAPILEAACLELDDTVEIHEEAGCILIAPVKPKSYHLDSLVSKITAKNRHNEVDTGGSVGKEVW